MGSKMEVLLLSSFVALFSWMLMADVAVGGDVTYDGRALVINGTRRMLFSGSIHYPRSTPEMWPSLIAEAKAGGLDVIQTYVFWNIHEPVQGQYNFEGRYDLVKFIQLVQAQGLYVSLRIGPFIEAEWNYGGFPFWLHDVPGIDMRCHNGPFESLMQKFVSMIVDKMKSNSLYASQGGPIIISQIENEYQNAEAACHETGPPYVKWAAAMAVGLRTGVPWMMCKQSDAPDPVINTCNGMNCAKTFEGPNSPEKPAMWTENWTFSYQVYGKETRTRSAEDLAFATALFIAKMKGSFVNYYMYHGGTNFGRSGSSYVITSYYDPAPLDEYGLIWLPTWGHLKELHAAVKSSSQALLFGTYRNQTLGTFKEAHVYEDGGHCSAFLVNYDARHGADVQFSNATYQLPAKSISILPDCKTVAFNTAKVNAQTGTRRAIPVQLLNQHQQWGSYRENISNVQKASFQSHKLLEQMSTTKDVTDYLWYTTRYNNTQGDVEQTLHVESTAHVFHVYVNDQLLGIVHGSHDSLPAPFDKLVSFKAGENNISLLSGMVGLPDSGAHLQTRTAGIKHVSIRGPTDLIQDLTKQTWSYQVGLDGEAMQIHTKEGSPKAGWKPIDGSINQTLIWYKTTFDSPADTGPMALNLSSMSKGEVWINGQSIGRYWVSFKNPSGQSTQTMYHVPRSFLLPKDNLLVIFEEIGGDPTGITLDTIVVSKVCSKVAETYHPSLFSEEELPAVQLQCPQGKTISSIEFASYGNPLGGCGSYARGTCHSDASIAVAEKACLGKNNCSLPVSATRFGGDPCPGTEKSLLVVANCS